MPLPLDTCAALDRVRAGAARRNDEVLAVIALHGREDAGIAQRLMPPLAGVGRTLHVLLAGRRGELDGLRGAA
jgi:hypothetical protein